MVWLKLLLHEGLGTFVDMVTIKTAWPESWHSSISCWQETGKEQWFHEFKSEDLSVHVASSLCGSKTPQHFLLGSQPTRLMLPQAARGPCH